MIHRLACCLLALAVLRAGEADATAAMLDAYAFVGGGSGVVVDPAGLVLTNHHVIDNWEEPWEVRFRDGSTAPASLVGTDPVGDIALLRVRRADGRPLTAATFAPASALVAATPCWAVGNPFALGDFDDVPTLSAGVLATGRVVREDYADCVISDAPVNPGNSGGPLYDAQARILGINGQIRSRTGFRINSGIGLAISSVQLQRFLPALAAADGGFVRHTAPPAGLDLADGPLGPTVRSAGESGLLVGDLIVAIDGRPVASAATAVGCWSAWPWSDGLRIPGVVQRGDQRISVELPVGRTPIPGRPWHGLTVGDGPLVLAVDEDSPAQRAGIRKGDRIATVEGVALTTRLSWLRAMARREIGDSLRITVARPGNAEPIDCRLILRAQP